MSEIEFETRVGALSRALEGRGERLATAESCTGGWVAKVCTDRAGSSAWFECGLVTYSNAAKASILDVPLALIERHGAVSAEVVDAMARGVLARSSAHWSVAISGIAGPGGGTADKPVGTVWLAWARRDAEADCRRLTLPGDRDAVRSASVIAALDGLLERLAADD